MRERIIDERPRTSPPPADEGWLALDTLALVEVTSEDAEHTVESALVGGGGSGVKRGGWDVMWYQSREHLPMLLMMPSFGNLLILPA
jgi:hypothetical protein